MSSSVHRDIFADGEWAPAADGGVAEIINPATEQAIGTAAFGTPADAERACAAARTAFDDGRWSGLKRPERSAALRRFHASLAASIDYFVQLGVIETGALPHAARAFARSGLKHLEFAANIAEQDLDEPLTPVRGDGRNGSPTVSDSLIHREPVGVVVALTPYNAPFLMTLAKIGPALAMGNTIVVKPSELAPLQVLALGAAAQEAELPPGVLNVVTGGPEVGSSLTTDSRTDMISFTGSDAVGVRVMAAAAGGLKKVVLELGGKSAMIVRSDADVAAAARTGLVNTITMAGQGCALLTRHLVHRDIYPDYVRALRDQLRAVRLGDPSLAGTDMGPVISPAQRAKVEQYVDGARASDAIIETGGARPDLAAGFFYQPTLVHGVDNSAPISREEIFGPVAVVLPFGDDDEAVAIANDSPFGLSGAVLTADRGRGYEIAMRLRTGRVMVNNAGVPDYRLPFGGFKRSGLGREFGREGALEYTQVKSVQW
jgi:aldehyde dehydrogenase (NAD+)